MSDESFPKMLLLRDSYAHHTIEYLPAYFSESLYIWDNWKYMLNEDIIEIEKPDVVIFMLFEGFIHRLLYGTSFVETETDDKLLQ